MRAKIVLVLLLALLSCRTGDAFADKRVALVIANANYQGAPLSNPEIDLKLVAPALEQMGFDVTAVSNADFGTFDQSLSDFAKKADSADIALFYFAGHGFALNDGIRAQSYLMSTSADVSAASDRALRRDGIALDEIVTMISSRAKTSLIFIDACRNDPKVRSIGGGAGRGLAPISASSQGDVFVGLSTRLGEVAADGEAGKGSPFARAFVEHIAEPGENILLAFNKVRLSVEKETGIQRPEIARADLQNPAGILLGTAREPVVQTASLPEPANAQSRNFRDALLSQVPEGPLDLPAPGEIMSLCPWSFAKPSGLSCRDVAQPPAQKCDRLASTAYYHLPDVSPVPRWKVDVKAAVSACIAALEDYPNNTRFMVLLAGAALANGDLRMAALLNNKAAQAGDPVAMYVLATQLLGGRGVQKNEDRGAAWTMRSEEAGYPEAMARLWLAYQNGEWNLPKDQENANALREKALQAGSINAAFWSAQDYLERNDLASAKEMLTKAEELGTDDIAQLYRLLSRVDPGKAASYLDRLISEGDAEAINLRALETKNGPEQIALLERAAVLGHTPSMLRLATIHTYGSKTLGLSTDLEKAEEWLVRLSQADFVSFPIACSAAEMLLELNKHPDLVAEFYIDAVGQRADTEFVLRSITRSSGRFTATAGKELQSRLKALGVYGGAITGVLDEATMKALRQLGEG